MSDWLIIFLVILWVGSSLIVWRNIYTELERIHTRKHLLIQLTVGVGATICGPVSFIIGGLLWLVEAIWERWKELKEKP